MVHRRLSALFLLFIALVLPAYAQDADALFTANFDDGTLPEALNIQYGTHEIVDGQLNYTVDNGGFLVIPSGIDWTDYAIETTLTLVDGSVWIQARTGADLCTGYYLTLNPDNAVIDLSVADRECNFTVLSETDAVQVPSDAFTARLDVEGDQIRAYINGDLILSAADAQIMSGYPTLNVFPIGDSAQVQFDRIDVLPLLATVAEPETTPESTEQIIPTPVATTEPDTLVDVELPPVNQVPLDDDPNRVIESLVELGLIPHADGELYTAEGVSIARIGGWFEPLFDDVSSRHAVMSGDIFFLPNNAGETCLLSARIERDDIGVAFRYLDVGINSLDEVYVGETADNGEYSLATQEGLLTAAGGNVLFVAYGDKLSVYVNGRIAFQNIDVTRRDGSFGVSSNSTTSYTVCHVTNIWAYTLDG